MHIHQISLSSLLFPCMYLSIYLYRVGVATIEISHFSSYYVGMFSGYPSPPSPSHAAPKTLDDWTWYGVGAGGGTLLLLCVMAYIIFRCSRGCLRGTREVIIAPPAPKDSRSVALKLAREDLEKNWAGMKKRGPMGGVLVGGGGCF